MTYILFRHLSGSKVNQTDRVNLDDASELTLGRDPSCSIAYDPNKDDGVSRRHAVVRVINGEKLGFTLGDLNSANGTFLDGQKVTAEIELLPGQTIDLGPGGPKVVFDVEPRPAHLVARTRTIKQPRTTRITAAATASYDSKADRVADAQTDAILLPVLPSGNSLNVEKLRDRHEKTYLAVLWLANVLLFIVIAIIGFVDLNTLLIITLYGAFLAFFVWISWKLSFAFVYGHGIEVGPNQYPQIYSVVKRASELLEVPVPTSTTRA